MYPGEWPHRFHPVRCGKILNLQLDFQNVAIILDLHRGYTNKLQKKHQKGHSKLYRYQDIHLKKKYNLLHSIKQTLVKISLGDIIPNCLYHLKWHICKYNIDITSLSNNPRGWSASQYMLLHFLEKRVNDLSEKYNIL